MPVSGTEEDCARRAGGRELSDATVPRYFPFLTSSEEADLLRTASVRRFEGNEVVLEQNAVSQAIYVIEQGLIRIEQDEGGVLVPIARLGGGEFFGEMSFVDGEKTSAQATTEGPTVIRVIDATLISSPTLGSDGFSGRFYRSISAILARRLRRAQSRFQSSNSWG